MALLSMCTTPWRTVVAHRLRFAAWVLGATFQLGASITYAEVVERVVWAQVTHVEPISQSYTPQQPAHCSASKPTGDLTLAQLLAWDLDPSCYPQAQSNIVGYDVEYHWDGRRYRQQLSKHPGDRLPLRIKIR